MAQDADWRSYRFIESDQQTETFFHDALDEDVEMRLLSLRCQDARQADLPCQDYALLICHQRSSLTFCVSDGVGSSYRGDFAAHYLTHCLVDWLRRLPDLQIDAHILTAQLEQQLHLWAEPGQEELEQGALPADMPKFLHEILLEHRGTHGSETVFFAGRIDSAPRSSATWDRRALFCWMGNVSAQLFFVPGKYTLLCAEEQATSDRNRWSTVRGPRGLLTGLSMDVSLLERLIIYTDGLAPVTNTLAELDDEALLASADELLRLPANDDMTLLDLQWRGTGRQPPEAGRHA